MTTKGIPKLAQYSLDHLTDAFPRLVPRVFQKIFLSVMGSGIVSSYYHKTYQRRLGRIEHFDRILVVPDVNIGDAVLAQPYITILRYYFPNARIDYVCNRTGRGLIGELPGVDRVFGLFRGHGTPTEEDLGELAELIRRGSYSLILNFSPYISKKDLQGGPHVLQMYIPFAAFLIRRWKKNSEKRHISLAAFLFASDLFAPFSRSRRTVGQVGAPIPILPAFEGNFVYLSQEEAAEARRFLNEEGLAGKSGLLLYHPDTPSRYTQVPPGVQSVILKKILLSKDVEAVLLGAGHASPDIERTILSALPKELWKRIVIVPRMPLNVYAALIDAADMFISGDTGPAHIAAAWKVAPPGEWTFRNRTAVVTVFGSSDSRLNGYDSERAGYISSHQMAPSKAFESRAPCRNISCMNKEAKSCREVRCFNGLDAEGIADYVVSYFARLKARPVDRHHVTEGMQY